MAIFQPDPAPVTVVRETTFTLTVSSTLLSQAIIDWNTRPVQGNYGALSKIMQALIEAESGE